MKNIKLFNSLSEAIGLVCETPLVSTIKGMTEHVLYASSEIGEEVEIIENEDIDGFINYQKYVDGPANNEIWYTSTDGNIVTPNSNYFNETIVSNTYNNGKGVITFSSTLTEILDGTNSCDGTDSAFGDLYTLKSVTLPEGLTSIGHWTFADSLNLTTIIIPNTVEKLGDFLFSRSGIVSINIPNSVNSISSFTFSYSYAFTNITIDSGNTTYNDGNGSNCVIETSTNTLISGCKTTSIPNSVTSIGYYAFDLCTELTSITIPDSVTSIYDFAFRGCVNLTSITISDSVTSIGTYAFAYCIGLTSITIPNSVTSIHKYAFYNIPKVIYSGTATGSPWGAKKVVTA